MRVTMHGAGHIRPEPKRKDIDPPKRTLVSRMWRLGDIVMCEPVSRYLSKSEDVSFSTKPEYHPIVQAFHMTPPSAVRYPLEGEGTSRYQRVIDLDGVSLVHDGHVSKVDAFLSRADIDLLSLSEEERRPTIDLPRRYSAWAEDLLSKRRIASGSLVCIARQSWSDMSPRNLPRETIDEVCRMLARDHLIIVLGAMPAKMGRMADNIHNLTGSTPDVMSTAGVMANSRVLITMDTGLMHIAGAIGVPMVTVMGPTRPDDVSSFYRNNTIIHAGRDGCCPCFERGCGDPCIRSVSADMIVEVVEERISNPTSATRIVRP